jgi:D-3-phosphoglycerate dehydrogenase
LITTVPFADNNDLPIRILEGAGIDYVLNPYKKKLSEEELISLVADFEVIIAGTEEITARVMDSSKNLKMISRVGVGLNSVNLNAAKERNIQVSYTPDAPAPAVAELTVGLMLNLLRMVHVSNDKMHQGKWERFFGRRLSNVTIGLIGAGRIGTLVASHLTGFGSPRILVNDLERKQAFDKFLNVEWTSKEKIFKNADIISLHLPLTKFTRNMISRDQLLSMNADAIIINTARGGIINENDLYEVIKSGHLQSVAIDVFESEPYSGPLREIPRCLLTSHMGSMSIDCRSQMEIEATREAVNFLTGGTLKSTVPDYEYNLQK